MFFRQKRMLPLKRSMRFLMRIKIYMVLMKNGLLFPVSFFIVENGPKY